MANLFDQTSKMPADFSSENEEEYFSLLTKKECGPILTNISELALESSILTSEDAQSQNQKVAAFWFRTGLKFYEKNSPDEIERHLVLLALFYYSNKKNMLAEGMFRQVLEKVEN